MTVSARDPFPDDDAALLRRLSLPPSPVAGGERPWGFLAGLAGTAGLGLVVFLSMSAGRHARAQSTAPISPIPAAVAPPPAQTAPPPPPVPPPVQAASPITAPTVADEQARLRAPSMVVDLSDAPDTGAVPPSAGGPAAVATAGGQGPGATQGSRLGPDERFADRVASAQVDTARATRLANPALTAPQGTVISAVLETGINSDLPGFVRAVVSRDVSGFDGSTVLIPRGSKLIGEYKSGVAQGQSRAFVIWTRLLTPDGVSINLGSPATDTLGRGGVAGETNTHFVHRFGAAILLSVIGAGLQALANQASNNSVNAVIISTPQQANNVATVALQKDIDIPPTITVPQGQAIRVFVSRDLDFSDVLVQAR